MGEIAFRERDHREVADIRLRSMTSGKETATTVLKVAGGLVGTALLVWPLAIWLEVRKCERPKYKQLLTLGELTRAFYDRALAIDVREYASYVIAEVTVTAETMKEANSKGFRQVAGFIFGGNTKQSGGESEKIAMTSPVQTEAGAKPQNGGESEKIAMTSPVT